MLLLLLLLLLQRSLHGCHFCGDVGWERWGWWIVAVVRLKTMHVGARGRSVVVVWMGKPREWIPPPLIQVSFIKSSLIKSFLIIPLLTTHVPLAMVGGIIQCTTDCVMLMMTNGIVLVLLLFKSGLQFYRVWCWKDGLTGCGVERMG